MPMSVHFSALQFEFQVPVDSVIQESILNLKFAKTKLEFMRKATPLFGMNNGCHEAIDIICLSLSSEWLLEEEGKILST